MGQGVGWLEGLRQMRSCCAYRKALSLCDRLVFLNMGHLAFL